MAGLAVVLVLLAGACGWWDDETPTATTLPGEDPSRRVAVSAEELAPFAVDPDDVAGPGTPLGGELSVPEGAVLLGIPFPDLEGGGFRALMLITGDPVATYNAMVSQATAQGMGRDGLCLGEVQSIRCGGRFVDDADGESLVIDVRRSVGVAGAVSGLAVRYRPPGSEELEPEPEPAGGGPTTPLTPVDLPDEVTPPPVEDVGRDLRPATAAVRTVEEGSDLVGLPGPCACGGEGWSFVVTVDGRVRDVIAAYARQFSDLGEPPDVSDDYRGQQTTYHLVVGEDDRSAEVRAVAPEDGTAYLLVTVTGA